MVQEPDGNEGAREARTEVPKAQGIRLCGGEAGEAEVSVPVTRDGVSAEEVERVRKIERAAPELLAALKGIMNQIVVGALVRETADDNEPGWGMRQIPLVMALKAADDAIREAENG